MAQTRKRIVGGRNTPASSFGRSASPGQGQRTGSSAGAGLFDTLTASGLDGIPDLLSQEMTPNRTLLSPDERPGFFNFAALGGPLGPAQGAQRSGGKGGSAQASPSIPREPQVPVQFTLGTPEAPVVLNFRGTTGGLGSALQAVQGVLTETEVGPDDLYKALGADPTDANEFVGAVKERWEEAMQAAMGDPEAATQIFQNRLYFDGLEAGLPPLDQGGGSSSIGTQNPIAALAESLGFSDEDILRQLAPGFFAEAEAVEQEEPDWGFVLNPQYGNDQPFF